MTSALAILAATLSLTSPTNYFWTTPATTNLQGVGMGTTVSYVIPRIEDIAFLREAYLERTSAVNEMAGRPPIPTNSVYNFFMPGEGAALQAGKFLEEGTFQSVELEPWFLTTNGWTRYFWNHGKFVAPTFAVTPFGPRPADANFVVNGVSTDSTNGLGVAVSTWDGLLVDPALIATNVFLEGALDVATLTNAYGNLKHTGAVLGDSYAAETGSALVPEAVFASLLPDVRTSYTNVWQEYTYTDAYGQPQRGRTAVDIVRAGVTTNAPSVGLTNRVSGLSLTPYMWATKEKVWAYGTRIVSDTLEDGAQRTVYSVTPLGSYVHDDAPLAVWNWPESGASNVLTLAHACLSTNAVIRADLIDDVEFYELFRVRRRRQDRLFGMDVTPYTSNTLINCTVLLNRDPAQFVATTNGYHIYRGSSDIGGIIRNLFSGYYPSIADSEIPAPDIPSVTTNYAPSESSVTIQRTVYVDVECLVYPLIHRRYNADFTD